MKREIKFRAWSKLLNCMSEVLEIDFEHDAIRCVPGHLPKNKLSDSILLQSTGLKDKNGKEIYERDVVKKPVTLNKELHGEFSFYEVTLNTIVPILSYIRSEKNTGIPRAYMTSELSNEFRHESIAFGENVKTDGLEIIGNIYENPELIK